MNIRELIPEEAESKLSELMNGGGSYEPHENLETKRLTRNGRVLDIRLTMTPLKDDSGEVYAVATTERNISEFKEKEKEYRKEISRLKNKLNEIREES
jgi:PAS domain S-box-containing protein